MAAYLMADVFASDMDKYRDSGYLAAVPEIAARFGGRYLARGGAMEVLEGDWRPTRMVIIEFPNMADLKAFYESAEYAPWRAIRRGLTESKMVALEGLSEPPV